MKNYVSSAKKNSHRVVTSFKDEMPSGRMRRILMATAATATVVAMASGTLYVHSKASQQVLGAPMTTLQSGGSEVKTEEPEESVSITKSEEGKSVETTVRSNGSAIDTDVTVNGRPIEVPQNGTIHKTFTSDNGKTEVSISTDSTSTGSSSTSTTTNLHVNTKTFSQNLEYNSP